MKLVTLTALVIALGSGAAWFDVAGATPPDPGVAALSGAWAEATFREPESARADLLKSLAARADAASAADPGNADLLTWAGIIEASYAGAKGGLDGLKAAKRARGELEEAMRIDPEALDGGARTSLGALYYKVPGWPIGFGDDDKAEKLLATSANAHPDNLNALYFYADYLMSRKREDEAREWFAKAALIAPREGAMVADEGRLAQVRDALAALSER